MSARLQKRNQGFTIVETLIVLAIAGLIILIVLLAVPALQRNSRNTNIKSDVSAIAGGVTEFESNNNGETPDTITQSGPTVTFKNSADTSSSTTTAKVQGSTVVQSVATAAPTTPPTAGTIVPVKGLSCDGTKSTRAYALYYSIETPGSSNGLTLECLDT